MAVYVQPYNPWKEQAALSLLGGFIDKWQQSEQNRKANAFRGQLQQNISALTGGDSGISLMPQNEPEGYNANPWASAFHKTDNPLTQFNIGTAASQTRLPTIADIANQGAALAGSKRFSGMNPDTVQKIIGEMSQAAELQRMNDLRSQYAQQFGAAGSFADQVKAITGLAMQGGVDYRAAGDFAQWNRPRAHLQSTIDAGDRVIPISFDQDTGKTTFLPTFMKGVNPDTKYEATSRENVANIAAGAQYAAAEAAKSEWDFKRTQEALKIEQDNLEQAINDYQSMKFQNDEQRQAFYDSRIAPIKQRIEAYQSALIQGVSAYAAGGGQTSQNTQQTNFNSSGNIAFDALGNVKGLRISKNGHFGAARKGHTHAGLDISVPVGTPVRVTPNMGQELTVVRADNKDATGYGNLVVLETSYNGHKINFYFGHLDDNSYSHLKVGQKVKTGDIIAKSGNTGRSSGPHLHFEVRVDGKPTDPATFMQNFGGLSAQRNPTTVTNLGKPDTPTAQNTPNTGIQSTSAAKNSPISSSNNNGGFFAGGGDTDNAPAYVNSEGEIITNSQFKALEQKYGTEKAMTYLEARGFLPHETSEYGNFMPTEQQLQTTEPQPTNTNQQQATPNANANSAPPQVIPMSANSSGSQSLASAPFAARFVSLQPMPIKQMQGDWTVDDIANYIKTLFTPQNATMSATGANPFSSMMPGANINALPPNNPASQVAGDSDALRNQMNFSDTVNYVKSLFNRNSTQSNFNPYVPLHLRSDFSPITANPTSADFYPLSSDFTPSSSQDFVSHPMHIRQMQDTLTVGDMANYVQSLLNTRNGNMNNTYSNPYAQLLMRSGLTPTPDSYNPQASLTMRLLWPNLSDEERIHLLFMGQSNPKFKGGN